MSLRRLVATTAVMAAAAALLVALTPDLPAPSLLVGDPQAFADAAGPDTLVLTVAALLAWTAWGWGALGLLLTGLSAVPGLVGAVAGGVARLVLPADARRAATLALGLGLAVGSPVLSACSPDAVPAAAVSSLPVAAPVPDWPAAPGGPTAPGPQPPAGAVPPAGAAPPTAVPPPVPDWPAGQHVVVRGDSLWHIAAADLRARTGGEPAAADVARATAAWWSANEAVIGPDPDLLLPGQVLRAPAGPFVPVESESPE